MSRHRNMRHLIAEEDYDYDDYDDDYVAPPKKKPVKKPQQPSPVKKPPVKKAQQQQQKVQFQASVKQPAAPTTVPSVPGITKPPPGFGGAPPPPPAPTSVPPPASKTTVTSSKPTTTATKSAFPLVPPVLAQAMQDTKPTLTLVILGHVDAGKSTIAGHLLHAQTKSKRAPQNFAWLLDTDENERSHGVTMDIATRTIETLKYRLVLQDAPGHADYVPAAITGTASADGAVVVVDATDFGTAFTAGQLKEHLYLARGLGVSQILVAVNKMDLCEWDENVYNEICLHLKTFLTSTAGYAASRIRFVPLSGLQGINLYQAPQTAALTSWYKGPTFWQALDGFEALMNPQKLAQKPIRLLLTDVIAEQGKGVACRGKVVQGWMQQGESMTVLPVGDVVTISKLTSLQMTEMVSLAAAERQEYAVAGEMVDLVLGGTDLMRISPGSVLARNVNKPPLASKCRAKIWVLEGVTIPIIRGASCLFHMHYLDVPCHLTKLLRNFKKDGSTLKSNPRALTANTQAQVEIQLLAPICMEAFADCRAMGRFVLRRSGDSIAVGMIEQVLL